MTAEVAEAAQEILSVLCEMQAPWLSAKRAAAYLNCSEDTIYNLVNRGLIRRYGGNVGLPRFKREELDAVMASGPIDKRREIVKADDKSR